ncbi:gp436 family protein [Paludibacterium yongneupense]|uniref:gp436 family protein n=1 Tax=Paludibacterium yongneupense TaxID=400061 RepID=UPI0004246410|nr:phage protein Gp36 family protein [Paludibacterium yongneupense]
MAYAIQDDMVNRFGEDEVVALTDRSQSGQIDATVLAGALDDASAEIDTYLAGRYTLPLTGTPRFIAGLCCDIARYRLSGSNALLSEAARDRHRDAVRFLELAAAGKITLGEMPNGEPVQPGETIAFRQGTRIFSRDDRGGF